VFTKADIAALQKRNTPILTTEKDAMRLAPYNLPQLNTLGVRVRFLEEEEKFISTLENAIEN
jgi:tetraacyldisaccharide-1-P 4'-kinase